MTKLYVLGFAFWTIHVVVSTREMQVFTDVALRTPMRLIALHENGAVYVAARNSLYTLNGDLKGRSKETTGPQLDNDECPPHDLPCKKSRQPVDNEPRVLAVTTDSVLYCGALFQGLCMISSTANTYLKWVGASGEGTALYVAGRESTVGFFGPGAGGPNTFYTATTYDGRPLEYFPPSIASRRLFTNNGSKLAFSVNTDTSRTVISFHPNFKKTYKVNYVYGFSHGKFTYFVTTQRVSPVSEAIETRLARVCNDDVTFFSYMEIALKCHRGDAYNLATAAYLGLAGPSLQNRLNMEGSNDVLYITFVRTVPDHSYLVDKSKGTVLCSFPMSQVISYFTNATRDCFNAEPRTRLLPHIVDTGMKCKNHTEIAISDDFCGSAFNHYIEGREAIPGGVRSYVDRHVTSLAVTLQVDKTVAFLGTDKGDVIKIMLERMSGFPLYVENIAGDVVDIDKAIQKSNAFDKTHEHLYLLTGNKVVKFPAGSCSMYKTCSSCLVSEDPLMCGWCGSYCAHYDECEQHRLFTRKYCQPVIANVEPLFGPTAGGTIITITGDNFSSPQSGEVNHHISVHVADAECEIVLWTQTKLQCKTGPVKQELTGTVRVQVLDSTWTLGTFNINGTAMSDEEFTYAVPLLHGVAPVYGPVSGGTVLTLYGENLNIGLVHEITVAGVKCSNITLKRKTATCYTNRANDLIKGPVLMTIDDVHLKPKGNFLTWSSSGLVGKEFQYMPDPDIQEFHPQATTVSGTVNITVKGVHLDSVFRPYIVVVVTAPITGELLNFTEVCTVESSSRMSCPTPTINRTDLHTPSDRAPLLAHFMFSMDELSKLRDITNNPKDLAQLLYYPDPVYFPFGDSPEIVTYDQTELKIKGKDINLVHSPLDVRVLIDGNKFCKVTSMEKESLYCIIPPIDASQNDDGSLHSVEVRVSSLRFHLGNIEFAEKEASGDVVVPVMIWLTLVVLLGLAVFAIKMWRRRRRRKLPGFMVAYTPPSGDSGTNDYDGCQAPSAARRPIGNNYSATQIKASVAAENCESHPLDEETIQLLHSKKVERKYLSLGEVIGEGNFGCVYKGTLSVPRTQVLQVAVKTLRKNALQLGQAVIRDFLEEGLMMKEFEHPNVLGLVAVCLEDTNCPMVITPYMKYGDLHTYIGDESREPDVKTLLTFGIDIAKGMAYLSEKKFVHRDLAARNCMLGEDMVVRVADFGLSRDIYEREYYSSDNKKKLPVKWMAIESLENGIYTSGTDVWSYGVVLWELMTRGVLPYPDVGNWDILNYLKAGRRMLQPYCCPDLVYTIMLECWEVDPSLRPTFDELVVRMRAAVAKYMADNEGRVQKVGLKVQYVNCPDILQYDANAPQNC